MRIITMNSETNLLRQIHPSFVQNGKVTSQAFHPTPKDENKLSVYDGGQISCEGSWKHYTNDLGLQSDGTQIIMYKECTEKGLAVIPDPEAFKEHVLIDFSGLSNGQKKSKAKFLRNAAEKRGWCYEV